MTGQSSILAQEIDEIEAVLMRQRELEWPKMSAIASMLRARKPVHAITIARGSSDYVALYIGLLVSRIGRIPVASLTPSFASLYHGQLAKSNNVAIAVSQSGQSPDLAALLSMAKNSDAITLALLNNSTSPLSKIADFSIDIQASPERAVAATKSVIASIIAGARLIAEWFEDISLLSAIDDVSALVSRIRVSQEKCEHIAGMSHGFVIGRGMTLPIAYEAALKLKETCRIHAEAFSSAEILHGPAALITKGFPIVAFLPSDEARENMIATIKQLEALGANMIIFDNQDYKNVSHPLLSPLPMLHDFYRHVESVARLKGLDPDKPPHLQKVTMTV
jgi:glucosamine--fructose-6-phosphate aminotransferase (isomerizing)